VIGTYWGQSLWIRYDTIRYIICTEKLKLFCSWGWARETGWGVQERSLEVTEVLRRGGRRWCRHEAGLDIFWKKDLESLFSVCSTDQFLCSYIFSLRSVHTRLTFRYYMVFTGDIMTEWLGSVTVRTLNLRSRGRGFDSRSGRYQVVSTWMSDCLRTGKPSRYITNHQGKQPSIPPR